MKKGTKEFYAAQDCFERTLKSFPMIRAADTAREGGSVSGVYYQNGDTNSAFICFLQGVAYAKCEHVLPLRRDVAEQAAEIEKLKAENERLKAAQYGTPCNHKFHPMNDAGELSCVYCRETIWEQQK